MKKEIGLFGLLVCLCLAVMGVEIWTQLHAGVPFSELQAPRFISIANLTNNANLIGLYGVLSLGLGLVIITGGIDLSVGSMFALTGVLLAMALAEWHWPWPLATLCVVLLPMAVGWGYGWLVTRMNLQPFIVTLCGLLLCRGIARYVADDNTKGFIGAQNISTLKFLSTGKCLGVPMPFVILIVLSVVLWFLLHRSVYGRHLLAVGRNEQAARFSGINTRRVIVGAYVIAGLLTGISGIMFAIHTSAVSPSSHGNFFELYGIAAAVLGGCSLRGGEGSIIGVVIGTALLQVLKNLVNLLGITSSLDFAVMGTVVLIGVLIDQIFQNRAKKKLAR